MHIGRRRRYRPGHGRPGAVRALAEAFSGRLREWRRALDSGDLVLAHRLVHTLKGAAGMISAHGLHSHACALERALHEGARDAPLDALSAELARLRPAIDRLLDGQAAAATPPASAASDHALVARLADLLAQGDGAAIDLLEQSAASMTATLGPARFCDVARAANEFDFEAALKALRQDGEANAAGG
jgi:HPt (histidine-containing phosphotransfer) domain-containing protein